MKKGVRTAYVLALGLAAVAAHAQTGSEYPTKSVRLVAPFSAGGGADALARLLAKKLSDSFGQQVYVDNRGGASGLIGTEIAAKALPDGYTIVFVMGAHAINASVRDRLPYDPVRDFAPVGLFAEVPFILVVHPSLPVKSVPELVRFARARPGMVDYASTGAASVPHFAAEMLNVYAGLKMTHVSYKGVPGAIGDTLSGAVSLTFQGPLGVIPHVKSGKLRALGVTASKRSAAFPELPTIQEGGVPHYAMTNWYGVLAPKGTPEKIVTHLHQALVLAQRDNSVLGALTMSGGEPRETTPAQFRDHIEREIAKYKALVRRMGGLRID